MKNRADSPDLRFYAGSALIIGAVCLLASVGCERANPAPDLLRVQPEVYAPLEPLSLESLNEALASKGVGNVRTDDFRQEIIRSAISLDGKTVSAAVVYTDERFIPAGTIYQPMRVPQFLDLILKDNQIQGLQVDPTSRDLLTLSRAEMETLRSGLSPIPPLPKKTLIKP